MVALRITDEIVGLSEFETCNRRVKFCQDGEGFMCSSYHQAGNTGWIRSCWAGDICSCILSDWRDGLRGSASLVDANMQFRDAALIMEMLRQTWKISPFGEALHGPIWSIAPIVIQSGVPHSIFAAWIRKLRLLILCTNLLGHFVEWTCIRGNSRSWCQAWFEA